MSYYSHSDNTDRSFLKNSSPKIIFQLLGISGQPRHNVMLDPRDTIEIPKYTGKSQVTHEEKNNEDSTL